jgi:predicted RNA-binding protein with RPS1 domain
MQKLEKRIALIPSSVDLAAAEVELVNVEGRETILRRRVEAAEHDFDFVLLDCPPSLGLLTVNALAAATEVIIPMQPHFLALQGVGKLLETVQLVGQQINPGLKVAGIVLTMFDSQTRLSNEVVSDLQQFVDERFGMPTFLDIASELRSPAYDTRPPFRLATFKEGIDDLADLKPGMILEGVVTNVASFGAFVDVGVHQDGLVHVSRLADRFVKDPHEVVRAGDIVKVKVLEVDLERKRVALTMRFEKKPAPGVARASAPRAPREAGSKQGGRGKRPASTPPPQKAPAADTAMAMAFSRILKRG